MRSIFHRIWLFYYEGFRNLSWWGKQMWLIIIIKLFIIFAILKVFFFHDFLGSRFETETEKGQYVMEQLINPPQKND
ncbi:MAG TPA: DUF4492 domain-containing protein [Bacteroidales bacterium]|nr:DUF4492 domain-containing protein [Bacteroidales bacterium]